MLSDRLPVFCRASFVLLILGLMPGRLSLAVEAAVPSELDQRPTEAAQAAPAGAAIPAASESGIFPYPVAQEVLPNGLKVIVIPMDSPLLTYWSIVRTGSRDEVEPGRSGFAHFFEHMMFRGTEKYPAAVYDRIVTSMGADSNAYTTDDYTAYHLTFAKENLPQVAAIESDRFQNLSYAVPAFQTEAGAVYGEYKKGITQPFSLLDEKIRDLAYDVHTYKHTTIGFEADIKTMPEAYEYSLSFFRRFYRPENVVILIAGDVQPADAFELIKARYADWQPGYEPPQIVPEPEQTAERTGEVQYPGKTLPILQVAYKGAAFDPDNPLYVASVLLGELAFGETSELYKRLVLQEQSVQALQAYVPWNRDEPLIDVLAIVKQAEQVPAVRDEIFQIVQQWQSQPADPQRLDRLKRRIRYAFLMNLETPYQVAQQLARPIAVTGGIESVDRFYQAIERATAEDVMRAARTYFVPERRTVMVLKGAE